MADLVGPFYDTDGVASVLGVENTQVEALRDSGQVLGVQTSDDAWIYPTWQFNEAGVDPLLAPALAALAKVPPWSAAMWFIGPESELSGLTPLESLQQGNQSELVLRLAHQYAHHLMS